MSNDEEVVGGCCIAFKDYRCAIEESEAVTQHYSVNDCEPALSNRTRDSFDSEW